DTSLPLSSTGKGNMSSSDKPQLPMHVDKWIVTVREGKHLTRGDRRDSFFSKMSPVCELSLGEQGPFSTGVRPNTSHPSWDDSIEFEAAARQHQEGHGSPSSSLLSPSHPPPTEGGNAPAGVGDDGNGELPLPSAGPKLDVVCYSRSSTRSAIAAPSNGTTISGRRESGDGVRGGRIGMAEIGRAEVTLALDVGANSVNKVRIPLMRWNALGVQVSAGSVMLEYMFVPGIPQPPQPAVAAVSMEAPVERGCEQNVPEVAAQGGVELHRAESLNKKPALKHQQQQQQRQRPQLALLAIVGALVAVSLALRFGGVNSGGGGGGGMAVMPELSPIPVPLKVAVGKHKGSATHHIRLHEDGNIVVAMGPKPPPPPQTGTGNPAAATTAAAATTTLWQSGPLP
ncbi:unnamed protein product, partial [Pylaiella littoralis]